MPDRPRFPVSPRLGAALALLAVLVFAPASSHLFSHLPDSPSHLPDPSSATAPAAAAPTLLAPPVRPLSAPDTAPAARAVPAPPAVLAERDRVLARFATAPVPVAVVSISSQRIFVFDTTGQVVLHTRVSTGRGGISDRPGSDGTPLGAHRVGGLVSGRPGEILRGWGPTGRTATPVGVAHMTTRALPLDGLESRNRTSRLRGIFAHGTNKPHDLGRPRSSGCIRLSDDDAVSLAGLLPAGSLLSVVR